MDSDASVYTALVMKKVLLRDRSRSHDRRARVHRRGGAAATARARGRPADHRTADRHPPSVEPGVVARRPSRGVPVGARRHRQHFCRRRHRLVFAPRRARADAATRTVRAAASSGAPTARACISRGSGDLWQVAVERRRAVTRSGRRRRRRTASRRHLTARASRSSDRRRAPRGSARLRRRPAEGAAVAGRWRRRSDDPHARRRQGVAGAARATATRSAA